MSANHRWRQALVAALLVTVTWGVAAVAKGASPKRPDVVRAGNSWGLPLLGDSNGSSN